MLRRIVLIVAVINVYACNGENYQLIESTIHSDSIISLMNIYDNGQLLTINDISYIKAINTETMVCIDKRLRRIILCDIDSGNIEAVYQHDNWVLLYDTPVKIITDTQNITVISDKAIYTIDINSGTISEPITTYISLESIDICGEYIYTTNLPIFGKSIASKWDHNMNLVEKYVVPQNTSVQDLFFHKSYITTIGTNCIRIFMINAVTAKIYIYDNYTKPKYVDINDPILWQAVEDNGNRYKRDKKANIIVRDIDEQSYNIIVLTDYGNNGIKDVLTQVHIVDYEGGTTSTINVGRRDNETALSIAIIDSNFCYILMRGVDGARSRIVGVEID